MKILIAADLHWPTINGVATFSRNLAKGLSARGHEVLVIAPSQTGKSYEEYDGNYLIKRTVSVPFLPINNIRISVSPYLEVRKIIKDFQPDVIHVQSPLMVGLASLQVGGRNNIPLVATNHAMSENLIENMRLLLPMARPINRLLKEYARLIYRNVSYMTLPTESAIGMFGDTPEKMPMPIEAVSNGVDLRHFKPGDVSKDLYDRFKLPTDRPIVMYVGRLDAEKHISTLVKAFTRVREKHDAHLLVVGYGNDSDRLQELARDKGIMSDTTFTGFVSEEDKELLYRLGTVYCMTSPAELQCISMLEAMASGLPVVSVDAGPLKELCQDGHNGYLCEVDNDSDMADKISKILSDENRRQQMGVESLAIATTHDLQHTLDRFEAIYSQVFISPRRPQSRLAAALRLRKPR
ncbi:MAG TPA: glycosyltransferase [Candidatus Saccharimonadales bacterium]|nr:glycosyltransferase [Candidatus Saccharimonadales bacterium]